MQDACVELHSTGSPKRSILRVFMRLLTATCVLNRFNQGEGKEENAIVTSTGQYVVAWDFAKVKKGQLDKYEIKKYVCRLLFRFVVRHPSPPRVSVLRHWSGQG